MLRASAEKPGLEVPDLPYHAYLPIVRNQACEIVFHEPPDNAAVPGGQSFVARWTLRNTGSTAWLPGSAAIRYASGDRLHSGGDVRDLPYEVKPGEVLDFQLTMIAPGIRGAYGSNWEIDQGDASLCQFNISIQVP